MEKNETAKKSTTQVTVIDEILQMTDFPIFGINLRDTNTVSLCENSVDIWTLARWRRQSGALQRTKTSIIRSVSHDLYICTFCFYPNDTSTRSHYTRHLRNITPYFIRNCWALRKRKIDRSRKRDIKLSNSACKVTINATRIKTRRRRHSKTT